MHHGSLASNMQYSYLCRLLSTKAPGQRLVHVTCTLHTLGHDYYNSCVLLLKNVILINNLSILSQIELRHNIRKHTKHVINMIKKNIINIVK